MSGVTNYGSMDARVGSTYAATLEAAGKLGNEMDVSMMMMAVMSERTGVIDKEIRGQMGDMMKRNTWLREATSALSAIRALRPASDDAGAKATLGNYINSQGQLDPVFRFLNENKIAIAGGAGPLYSQAEFDQTIQNVKASIDMANSSAQMDQVRMQGLMEKRNQTFESLSNSLSKFGKTADTIIGNSR